MNTLGRTGLNVSEICLGTMTWGVQNDQKDADAQINFAKDAGVNFIDTAEMYAVPAAPDTAGKTETHIGNHFKTHGDRDKWTLATKVTGHGMDWIRDGRPMDPAGIANAIEGSLQRLNTDYVDLYQLHWPNRSIYHFDNGWGYDPTDQDPDAIRDEMLGLLEALNALVTSGKVRHIGVSNETAWGVMQYLNIAGAKGLPRIASIQNEFSLAKRQFEFDLAETCNHEQVGLLAYSPLGAGTLSGKYLDGAMPSGSRGDITGGLYRHNEFSEPAIRGYVNLARDHGLDPCQMAIAYARTRPFMTSVIIGATSMIQLKNDIAAADLKLDATVLEGIDAIHRRYPRPF